MSTECHSRWHLWPNFLLDCLGIPAASERHKVTNADHHIQMNRRWPHPITMSGMLLHPWISCLWRLASVPSLRGLFLHMLICWSHWMFPSLLSAENFDNFHNQNSHPRRGWASWEASRNPRCSLSPTLSATSTNMPSVSTTSHIFVSSNIISSAHLPIRCSLI